jgi:hypothetical protein
MKGVLGLDLNFGSYYKTFQNSCPQSIRMANTPHSRNQYLAGRRFLFGGRRQALGLPQVGALCLGLLQDVDTWIGILPQCKGIFVGQARLPNGVRRFECLIDVQRRVALRVG